MRWWSGVLSCACARQVASVDRPAAAQAAGAQQSDGNAKERLEARVTARQGRAATGDAASKQRGGRQEASSSALAEASKSRGAAASRVEEKSATLASCSAEFEKLSSTLVEKEDIAW